VLGLSWTYSNVLPAELKANNGKRVKVGCCWRDNGTGNKRRRSTSEKRGKKEKKRFHYRLLMTTK
jgi:hypothetical protein